MTFKDQLKQSRISFCVTRATHEFEVQYGEGESATTITITVSAVSRHRPIFEDRIHCLRLVMPITRVIYAVLRKNPSITLQQSDAIERYLQEQVKKRSLPREWWYRAGELIHVIKPRAARKEALRVGIEESGVYSDENLRQYALSSVAELLDYVDGLVHEWLANNKE